MRTSIIVIVICMVAMSIVAYLLTPKPADDGKAHLTWVIWSDPTKNVQAEMFNRLNPDCKVTIDQNNAGIIKNIVQSSAGIGGDLIDGINEHNIQTYQSAGILLDLTDLAPKYGFTPDTLHSSTKQLCMVKVPDKNGDLIERQFSYPMTIDHSFLIYNKDIFGCADGLMSYC